MYEPKENVMTYAIRISKAPEGVLMVMLAVFYFAAFIFFDALVAVAKKHAINLADEYRIAFLLMPFLLFVVFLRMDMTARCAGDRALTIVSILVVASVPWYRIVFF